MTDPQPVSPNSLPKRKIKKRKPHKLMYWLFGVVLAASLATGGYVASLYFYKFDSLLTKIGTDEEVPKEMSAKVKPLTMLLLGLDNRPETGSLNTDVIMIASLNPISKSAAVVSIPRDTYIKPTLGQSGNKANAFYANYFVDNPGKAKADIKAFFGKVMDIPIDYVVMVNFKGFQDVVDAIGGITVDVDMDMRYVDEYDGTDINLKKGMQKLDGKRALDFVRYRKSNMGTEDSSDIQRNERQQKVVAQVLDKLKSPAGLVKLGDILDAVGNNVESDIPKEQMKDFIATYMGIDKDKIQYIHLEGEWKSPYIQISAEDWNNAKSALLQMLR